SRSYSGRAPSFHKTDSKSVYPVGGPTSRIAEPRSHRICVLRRLKLTIGARNGTMGEENARPASGAGQGPDRLSKGQTLSGLFRQMTDQFAGTRIGQTLSGQLSPLPAMSGRTSECSLNLLTQTLCQS